MTLTPQEIQTHEFHVRFRGFDVEEVDGFLEKVAAEFLVLSEENKKLASQLESLNAEMAAHRSQEKAFQQAILSAQQIADGIKDKSRTEAEAMVEEARREAAELREAANAEIAALEVELDRLERLRSQAREELQQLLRGYLDMVVRPPAPAPEPPPKAAIPREEKLTEPVDDLTDLYQKIELPSAPLAGDEEAKSATASGRRSLLPTGDADDDRPFPSIPDLDDEVVFSLEDPLDDHEPAVSFGDLKDEKK